MDPDARQRLETARARTAARLRRLRRQLERAEAHGSGELSSYDNHPADQATSTASRTLAVTLVRRWQQRLDEVDAALARWAEGRYGLCERCGRPIEPARLSAEPAARWCRTCAAAMGRLRTVPSPERTLPGEAWKDPAWLALMAHGNSDTPQDRGAGPKVSDQSPIQPH